MSDPASDHPAGPADPADPHDRGAQSSPTEDPGPLSSDSADGLTSPAAAGSTARRRRRGSRGGRSRARSSPVGAEPEPSPGREAGQTADDSGDEIHTDPAQTG